MFNHNSAWSITREEIDRILNGSICHHINKDDGSSMLVKELNPETGKPNGFYVCDHCGARFNMNTYYNNDRLCSIITELAEELRKTNNVK